MKKLTLKTVTSGHSAAVCALLALGANGAKSNEPVALPLEEIVVSARKREESLQDRSTAEPPIGLSSASTSKQRALRRWFLPLYSNRSKA